MASETNLTTPVYDIDGDSDSFSQQEVDVIQEAWARVSEDFIPFNVDITTDEPPELATGVPESEANGKALRVSIGETWGSTAADAGLADSRNFGVRHQLCVTPRGGASCLPPWRQQRVSMALRYSA